MPAAIVLTLILDVAFAIMCFAVDHVNAWEYMHLTTYSLVFLVVFSISALVSGSRLEKAIPEEDKTDEAKKKFKAAKVSSIFFLVTSALILVLILFVFGKRSIGFISVAPFLFGIVGSIAFAISTSRNMYGYREYRKLLKKAKAVDHEEFVTRLQARSKDAEYKALKEEVDAYIEKRKEEERAELHKYDGQLEYEGQSRFDGNFWQYLGWKIVGYFVTLITLGILYPVAVNMMYRWEVKHTVINGRRLSYDGTAGQLLGKWIIWWLLSIVTLGIYALLVPVRIKAWTVKHSTMAGGKEEPSRFIGTAGGYVGMKLLTFLIKVVTLGLLTTVAEAMMIRWTVTRTVYNGYHMTFDGNGGQLFGKYLTWTLLGIITLGIYFLFIPIKLKKWTVKHSQLEAIATEVKD